MKNEHSLSIPADVLKQANQKADELLVILEPYLLALTADERMGMLKMGDKTLGFVAKTLEFAGNNPSFCPSYLNMDDFKVDVTDALGLRGLLNKLQQATSGTDDTMMIAGSEAYSAALVFYGAVKGAAEKNIPGAKAVYDELKKRFPGRGKAKGTNDLMKEPPKQ